MIRTFCAVFATTLVAACSTTPDPEPQIRTIEVVRPVPVSCVPANAQVEPNFRVNRADVAAAPDAAERLRLLGAGFLERDAYVGEALPVLRGCKDVD